MIEEPEVWGVEQLGANGIAIRLVVKTRPSEQFRVSRELRRQIKAAFDREGIEIPFPQQTVWLGRQLHRTARGGSHRPATPAELRGDRRCRAEHPGARVAPHASTRSPTRTR